MKRITFVFLLLCILLMSGCSEQDNILGTWTTEEKILGGLTIETEYTFMENGIGKKRTVLGVEVDMVYCFNDDEDTLTITTSTLGIKNSNTYSYKFEKGTLCLSNETESLKLVRVVETQNAKKISTEENIESPSMQ